MYRKCSFVVLFLVVFQEKRLPEDRERPGHFADGSDLVSDNFFPGRGDAA